MYKVTRRGLMVGCSAAIAAWSSGVKFTAFGSAEDEPNQDILLVVFLRGGMDGLSAVMPIAAGEDRAAYEAARPEIAVPTGGAGAALALDSFFGLHAAGAPLHELYQAKKLAIVHAAGLTSDTRSHFDAMQYMELGTPGSKSSTSGWLTRHLQTATNLPAQMIMPAMAAGSLAPASLAGSREAIGMTSPRDFSLNTHWNYGDGQRTAMRAMYQGASWLHQAGLQTLDAVDVVESAAPGEYAPANGAQYPDSGFGRDLQAVAQMVKMQLGLRVATVDVGGWDTHEWQGDDGSGYFGDLFGNLARGLHAFYTDLTGTGATDHAQRLTVVVMSEFGRSFQENASRGTDHGHGNVMFVLGGKVNGGAVFGRWPSLATDQLYDRRDLEITTDYRQVLSEILIRRLGNPNLGSIFPQYTGYAPLNIVQGVDLPIPPPGAPTPVPGPADARVYLPAVTR